VAGSGYDVFAGDGQRGEHGGEDGDEVEEDGTSGRAGAPDPDAPE